MDRTPTQIENAPVNGHRGDRPAAPAAGAGALGARVAALRAALWAASDRDGFAALLAGWKEQLLSAVRAGDADRAEAWLRALVTDPVYPTEMGDLVEEALDEVSVPEVLDEVVVRAAAATVPGTGSGLVAAWGARMAAHLVRGMIAEHSLVSRRHLTEFLAWIGREDIRLLAAFRRDPHWFVVRNLAIALGRTGRPQAVPALESLLEHADPRVRVEVLRSLWTLRGDGSVPVLAAAISDREPRVRHAACSLLRASPGPVVVAEIAAVLQSRNVAVSEVSRLVGLIAERTEATVPATLTHLAELHGVGAVARAVRRAARAALKRRTPGTDLPAGPDAAVLAG